MPGKLVEIPVLYDRSYQPETLFDVPVLYQFDSDSDEVNYQIVLEIYNVLSKIDFLIFCFVAAAGLDSIRSRFGI